MRDIWFITDTHFGHKNIIKFADSTGINRLHPEGRPFESIEEHDETIIEAWNAHVKPQDKVYHLGDFTINPKMVAHYASRLEGHKRLIMGNHDIAKPSVYAEHFGKVMAYREFNGCVFSHVPIHPWQLERWRFNIHGHTHAQSVSDTQYINLCPEVAGLYRPWNFDEIMEMQGTRAYAFGLSHLST